MDSHELIEQATRIRGVAHSGRALSALTQARELTRVHAGEKSAFYKTLLEVQQSWSDGYIARFVEDDMDGFISHVENGLLEGISIERQAQIDVVSDILDQAQRLLASKDVHPAAAAVVIGAALEEFLRNWVEDAGLSVGSRKPGIETLSIVLREGELIAKQDAKDLTAWGGIRNHAAHGEWDEVSDRARVRNMLEGVNLFMRRYSS